MISFIRSLFRTHAFPIIVLCALLLLRFGPLLTGKVFFFGDDYYLMVPGKLFTVEWIKKGVFPLWNPYVLGGISWVGDINQSHWYISTLLFLFFPPALALGMNQALHLVIGFFGAFLLGRRWGLKQTASTLVAVIWTMGMNVTGGLNNMSILQSLVWIPWVMEAIIRLAENGKMKHAVWLSIVLAIFIFAGYPQFLVYAGIGGVVLSIWKFQLWKSQRKTKLISYFVSLIGASLFALLLSAVSILPFLETLQTSTRAVQSKEQSTMGSVQPIELLKIGVPSLFDHFSEGMRWGPIQSADPNLIFYIGWIGLVILAVRVLRKSQSMDVFFVVLVIMTVLFSIGSHLPGFSIIQNIIFIFKYSRGPGAIHLLTTLLLGLWLGRVLQESVVFSKKTWNLLFILFGVVACAGVIGFFLTHWYFPDIWKLGDDLLGGRLSSSPFHTLERDRVISRVVLTQLIASAVLAMISCWLVAQKNIRLFIVVLLVDLWFATRMLYVFAPASVYHFEPNNQLVEIVQNPQVRVLTRNYNTPYADYGTYYTSIAARAPFTDSYVDQSELQSFSGAKRMQSNLTPDWGNLAQMRSLHGYVTLLPQSANQYWNDSKSPGINSLPPIKLSDPRLREWSVKYYLVDNWFSLEKETLPGQVVAFGDKKRGENWELYSLDTLPRFRYEDGSAVQLSDFRENPNEIEFSTDVPSNVSHLIIADRWEPGWSVFVDGVKQEVLRTSSELRSFSVQSGAQRIHLKYQPLSFFIGFYLSLSSWILIVIYWINQLKKQKRV